MLLRISGPLYPDCASSHFHTDWVCGSPFHEPHNDHLFSSAPLVRNGLLHDLICMVICSVFVVASQHICLDHRIVGQKKLRGRDLDLHKILVSDACSPVGRPRSEL
jgi:hypothetical protein